MTEAILIAVAAVVFLWIAWTFNRLIRLRNRTRAGWSDIDVQLQRRHDLIPRLVDAVSAYARFEQSTLTTITELRDLSTRATHLTDKAAIEEQVDSLTRQLVAVAESYPDLKASQNFLALHQDLTETEDLLQYARRFYNGAVREFNTQLESFPDLIVAKSFGFRLREFFTAEDGASQPVEVRFN